MQNGSLQLCQEELRGLTKRLVCMKNSMHGFGGRHILVICQSSLFFTLSHDSTEYQGSLHHSDTSFLKLPTFQSTQTHLERTAFERSPWKFASDNEIFKARPQNIREILRKVSMIVSKGALPLSYRDSQILSLVNQRLYWNMES